MISSACDPAQADDRCDKRLQRSASLFLAIVIEKNIGEPRHFIVV